MGTGIAVLLIGALGLALAAFLLRGEPSGRNRTAVLAGAAGGFLLALLLALALGTGPLGALATATLGAAVLALVLAAQLRLFRRIAK
jgi:hypothetical protein